MSALTFDYGDRVRVIDEGRGTVVSFNGRLIGVRMDDDTPFLRWAYADGLVPAMSHQGIGLWHLMRAGAKRTNGHVVFGNMRKRQYGTNDGCISLTIYTELKPEVQR